MQSFLRRCLPKSSSSTNQALKQLPKEKDGSVVAHSFSDWSNWGKTVVNRKYAITTHPITKVGACNSVIWAKKNGLQVRASGYKHSWADVFPAEGQVHVAMLPLSETSATFAYHPPLDGKDELRRIELVGEAFKDPEDGKLKHLCKIGPAVTNAQFRTWAINAFKSGQPAWTVPLNVIMEENTFGGTNANMCHGAGIGNHTLSDLVTEIEFVNAKGELQTIGYKLTDPIEKQREGRRLIQTAAGCFGMLGIVTSMTFKLDQMTHARMKPTKPRIALAVPPPRDYKMSDVIPEEIKGKNTEAEIEQARKDFIANCNRYYSEFFWYPFATEAWVNCWDNDGDAKKSIDFPGKFSRKIEEVEEYFANLANESIMKVLSPKHQTEILSTAAMFAMPENEEVVTPLIDALHFRSGIQNALVQDFEFEIPIPEDKDGKPDFELCQRAWWDAMTTVYEWAAKNKFPMRLPLEMRIMGDSNMTMAPQRGNKFGTCSIEVLTTELGLEDPKEWLAFMQALTDKWSQYTDAKGNPLNIRPHPAKQWRDLTIQRPGESRMPIEDYLRNIAYRDAIQEFKSNLAEIARMGGYKLEDLQMFSNPLLNRLIHGETRSEPEQKISREFKSTIPTKLHTAETASAHLNRLFKRAADAHQMRKMADQKGLKLEMIGRTRWWS